MLRIGERTVLTRKKQRNLQHGLAIASLLFTPFARAHSLQEIEVALTNEHEFIELRDVEITTKDGKTALNGSAFKSTNHYLPWGSHIHIDLMGVAVSQESGEEEDILMERVTYQFRRKDFDDSGRFERFFKYVDLSDPAIEKIVLETFTQKHTDSCGDESDTAEP